MRNPDDRARDQLRRIAAILGVPLEALFHAGEPRGPRPSPTEIARLVEAFAAIPDPHARERILAKLEREAGAATR